MAKMFYASAHFRHVARTHGRSKNTRYGKAHMCEYMPRFCRAYGSEADTMWAWFDCAEVACAFTLIDIMVLQAFPSSRFSIT